MHTTYLDQIRKFEGYTPKAEWDYAQFTNGYGTKARFAGEVISKAEADRRFKTEIADARAVVDKVAPHVDEGTKAALTSLTYNAGPSWTKSGLGDAVRAGDLDRAREIFVQYNKAGGDVLAGLVNRRLAEAAWIGNPSAVGGGPAALTGAGQEMASANAAMPRLPITGATYVPVRAEVAQFVPRQHDGDPLGDLFKSVTGGAASRTTVVQDLKPSEAAHVTIASEAIESAMVSELVLMAQASATAAGSVLTTYHGDLERKDDKAASDRDQHTVSGGAVTQA